MRSIRNAARAAIVVSIGSVLARAQEPVQISMNSAQEAANAASSAVSVSADGRFFAFESDASNLVSDDTNGVRDVFWRDRAFGVTRRVSVSTSGTQCSVPSSKPSISADGRYVVFVSTATTLVPSDFNGAADIFLRDTQAGTTSRLTVTTTAVDANGESSDPDISGDGRYVVFATTATNLAPPDAGPQWDIVLLDRNAGSFTRVSRGLANQEPDGACAQPRVSDDGRFVAFTGFATNLVVGDFNLHSDVFLYDVQADVLSSVTVNPSSIIGNDASWEPALSATGDWVVFSSLANNLVANDTNGGWDVFRWKRTTGTFYRASQSINAQQPDGTSIQPSISSDGQRIAFRSHASQLTVGDTNGLADIFVRDVAGATTSRVSVTAAGGQLSQASDTPAISADGATVAYVSLAPIVATDSNAFNDVYAYTDRCTGASTYCTAKTNSNGCVPWICSAGLPTVAGADNFKLTAFRVLNQKSGIFFWGSNALVAPLGGGTRCVAYPVVRSAVLNSGGSPATNDCSGSYVFSFDHAYMALHGASVGAHVFGQFWSRDPFFAQPNNIGLTDGVEFTVLP